MSSSISSDPGVKGWGGWSITFSQSSQGSLYFMVVSQDLGQYLSESSSLNHSVMFPHEVKRAYFKKALFSYGLSRCSF